MTKGEKKKREQKLKRWEREERAFNADLNALLLKHKAKIVARSRGGTYHYPTTVHLDVEIGENSFDIGEDDDKWDTITVNGAEPPATGE